MSCPFQSQKIAVILQRFSEMEGAAFFVRERKFTFGSGLSDRYKQRLAGCKAGISATNK